VSESSPYEKDTRKLFYLGADSWLTWRDMHRSKLKDIERDLRSYLGNAQVADAIKVVKAHL